MSFGHGRERQEAAKRALLAKPSRPPRHRRHIDGKPVYQAWETTGGVDPAPVSDAPPPAPTNRERDIAAAERAAYFDYLNGRGPKPELTMPVDYWPDRLPPTNV